MSQTVVMMLDFVPNQHRTMEEFLLAATARLADRGWRTVFVFAGAPGDEFRARLAELDTPFHVARLPLRAEDAGNLAAALRPHRPVALTTTFMSPFDRAVLRLKRKLGVRWWLVHDQSSGGVSPKRGVKRLLARVRGWYFGRHLGRLLAVSDFVARRAIDDLHLPADKVRVVYNGVNVRRYSPAAAPAPEELVVAFVGQLIPEKGVHTLLKAVRELTADPTVPTFRVRLAGRGRSEDELRAYCQTHGLSGVEFLGQVRDVAQLYSGSAVVVAPSEWQEAFGFVIAEAMACGACVLASDAGGVPSVVGADVEGGILFRAGDAGDLAAKLRRLLADGTTVARYRAQARRRAERLFSLERMVDGFVDEFLGMTAGPQMRPGCPVADTTPAAVASPP